ncbi:MAG TPA: protein-export chaperone SecB [Oceanospirillaceae bacterium]|nr:protein-export chaperone SecB [Oceanospirillaceae bacterium]
MSEEEKGAAAQATEENTQPQIMIQRVYLKDLSFESPNAPQSFTAEWKPEVGVDLNSQARQLNETTFEVILRITITAMAEEKTVYLTEVQQAGLFHIANVPKESMGQVLGAFCPNILFPYAREAIDNLVQKGSFPALMLSPVNFDALYAQSIAQQAAQAEAGEAAAEEKPEQTH